MLSTDDADVYSVQASGKAIDLGGFKNYRKRTSSFNEEEVLEAKFSGRHND
jgi:hypothetical protein